MSTPTFRLICPHNGEQRPCPGCGERYGVQLHQAHRYEQLATVAARPTRRRHRCPDHNADLVIAE